MAEIKYPKRKVAILMGYIGSGYSGMQINPHAKTIEGELFSALHKAKLVSDDNSTDQTKISFMRSCRTDRGVHAAGQLVSAKLIVGEYPDEVLVQKLNGCLPKTIQIYKFVRVPRAFHAKNACSSRSYEYLLPTYILEKWPESFIKEIINSKDNCNLFECEKEQSKEKRKKIEDRDSNDEIDDSTEEIEFGDALKKKDQIPEETKSNMKGYRISSDQLQRLREIASNFVGTKRFHNYTLGKSAYEKSSERYIMECKVSDPLSLQDNLEWIRVTFKGQSFMLHQIRKMIGIMVLVNKMALNPCAVLNETFKQTVKVNIPKAPSQGLFLERAHFDEHNRRFSDRDCLLNFDGDDKVNIFKKEFIYPEIQRSESDEYCFYWWLKTIEKHFYEFNFFSSFPE